MVIRKADFFTGRRIKVIEITGPAFVPIFTEGRVRGKIDTYANVLGIQLHKRHVFITRATLLLVQSFMQIKTIRVYSRATRE